jgi:hypothetical protein
MKSSIQSDSVPAEVQCDHLKTVIAALVEALQDAEGHLEYCGYGDRYERECAEESKLPEKIAAALDLAATVVERTSSNTNSEVA